MECIKALAIETYSFSSDYVCSVSCHSLSCTHYCPFWYLRKIVTDINELHSYTKIYESFITRGITRLFHPLISFTLAFIFNRIFEFYKCKPMYFDTSDAIFQFYVSRKKTRWKKYASSALPCTELPRKRIKWSNESILNALEAVKKGSSIKSVAEEYGVPRTTL